MVDSVVTLPTTRYTLLPFIKELAFLFTPCGISFGFIN